MQNLPSLGVSILYIAPLLYSLDDPDPESDNFILSYVDDTVIAT